MKKLTTNVLIAGKSGVGKSALLNYLFGKQVQETGSGRPITRQGVYPFDFPYDDTFTIRIYDTWGLEPDKADDWRKLIVDEVQEHDKKNISEWFNTIIYCLNSNSKIVEDFEIENLKALQKEKNNIVIALTHCEKERGELQDYCMTNKLIQDAEIPKENIIYVNSVSKKTIGGTQEVQFGREKLFVAIIRNLWHLLKEKVPYRVREKVKNEFKEFQRDMDNRIDKKMFIFRRGSVYEKFEEEVMLEVSSLEGRVKNWVNEQFRDAMEYFNALSNKYASIMLLDLHIIVGRMDRFQTGVLFEKDIRQILNQIEESKKILFQIIKMNDVYKEKLRKFLKNFFKYVSSSRKVKKELKSAMKDYAGKAYSCVNKEIIRIERSLQSIEIEGISKAHLDSQNNIVSSKV